MSVIQNIRDKYARIAVIAIALALLGFILMDAFSGRSGLFGRNSTTLGSINGNKIDYVDFARKVKAQEDMAQKQGYEVNDASRQQIIESVWNSEVSRVLLDEEVEELGLTVGKKEVNDMLFGTNPPQDMKQGFTDPKTGVYNALQAQQYFNELKKNGTPEQKAQMNDYLKSLEEQRLVEKYTSLLASSTYFPKWFLEKQNADNSLMSKVSYVGVPYTTISDSAVKVTDDEIKAYINDNKKMFEMKDENRSISYVVFSAAPTNADSAAVLSQISALKPQFAAATDAGSFLAQQGSALDFYDAYIAKSKIQVPNADSIIALPKGGVFGPYTDGNNYVLARMVDAKSLPDSVKARHILIGTVDAQSGQPLGNDSIAKIRIDSIAAAIRGGASFDELEAKYSTDQAAHKDKGVMTFASTDIQGPNFAKEFGDFILNEGKTGDKKVVKTQFGWHYIEILEQKNVQPHYKIAYLAKPIAASAETDAAANNAANLFAGNSRNLKSFNDNYEKDLRNKNVAKLLATDIKPNDYSINGLGASRELVKDIYEADQGDVLQPVRIGDAYVVAAVTDVEKAGVASVAKARSVVEPVLRNKKKAEQIQQKIGNVTTLEDASAKLGQPIQTIDSLRFNGERNPALGYELKVLGAAFNPANNGKVVPQSIAGQAGVYVLRVDGISTTPVQMAGIDEQRRMMQMQARQAYQYRSPVEVLKTSADIKDNRAKFY